MLRGGAKKFDKLLQNMRFFSTISPGLSVFYERQIKQQRQDMIYAQKERVRKLFDGIVVCVGLVMIVGLIIGIAGLLISVT